MRILIYKNAIGGKWVAVLKDDSWVHDELEETFMLKRTAVKRAMERWPDATDIVIEDKPDG